MTAPMSQQEEPRYGWLMVALAPVYQGLGIGGLQAISVFLKPIGTELHWLRSQTAFAYLGGTLALGVGGIFMGYLADRFTTRRVAMFGSLVMALSYFAMSRMDAVWQFYAYHLLLGGVGAAAVFSPMLSNVGRWFGPGRGLAMGLTTAGQALGMGGVPYICALLTAAFTWRAGYLGMAIGSLLLVPLAFLIREPPVAPRPAAAAATGSTGPLPVSPVVSIGLLSLAAIFCCITMATPMVHMFSLATDAGLTVESAASVMLTLFLVGIVGRILYGRLADSIGALQTYMIASFAQTALVYGFVWLATPGQFYLLAAAYGFGFSGIMTSLVLCAQQYVPAHRSGLATGVVTCFGWLGMGLGGFQAGFFFDITGSYNRAFLNALIAGCINLLILVSLYLYRSRRLSVPVAQPLPA